MDEKLERSLSLLEDVTRGVPSHRKLLRLQEGNGNLDMTVPATSVLLNNSMFLQKRKPTKVKKTDLDNLSISIFMDQSDMLLLDQSNTTRFVEQGMFIKIYCCY